MFRANIIAEYTTKAVKIADKIYKKIFYLEYDGLFKVNGNFIRICEKGTAFDQSQDITLSDDARKWLRSDQDIINWKIGAFTLSKINELFNINLEPQEVWDLAKMSDNEKTLVAFQLTIDTDSNKWDALDEQTQMEVRIIFDAIDNPKYFLHSIDSYFLSSDDQVPVDMDYRNHLIARF
jgi:hypothetical protein